MEHCRQINFIADESTHSTRDCLVTVAWANEISAGVFSCFFRYQSEKNWKGLLHSDSFKRSVTKSLFCIEGE